MNITGLRGRVKGVKILNDYKGWGFRKWPVAGLTGWPTLTGFSCKNMYGRFARTKIRGK